MKFGICKKCYKMFGLNGHTFDRKYILLFREGDNDCIISTKNFIITLNIKLSNFLPLN